MNPPEQHCPECGGPVSWKVIHSSWGAPLYNGLCGKCNTILRGRETPEITKGKELEKGEMKGVPCMDKRITALPCDVQIGILRQRMHPKGTEVYSPYCKKCTSGQMQYKRKGGKYKCSVCGSINRWNQKDIDQEKVSA